MVVVVGKIPSTDFETNDETQKFTWKRKTKR